MRAICSFGNSRTEGVFDLPSELWLSQYAPGNGRNIPLADFIATSCPSKLPAAFVNPRVWLPFCGPPVGICPIRSLSDIALVSKALRVLAYCIVGMDGRNVIADVAKVRQSKGFRQEWNTLALPSFHVLLICDHQRFIVAQVCKNKSVSRVNVCKDKQKDRGVSPKYAFRMCREDRLISVLCPSSGYQAMKAYIRPLLADGASTRSSGGLCTDPDLMH